MGEKRDAARTRAKIVEAARDELAARGFAGARVESIAQRAGVRKQLLYHYFDSKEALFQEILDHAIAERVASLSKGRGAGAPFRERFHTALADPVWMRLLLWEAAEYTKGDRIFAEEARRAAIREQTAAIVERQAAGELSDAIAPEILQLAVYALAGYPMAFPQITRMTTGLEPESPEFQAAWLDLLDRIGQRLGGK